MKKIKKIHLDNWLLVSIAILILIGLLMVTSASSYTAERYEVSFYHYSIRQFAYVVIGLIGAVIAFKISLEQWYRYSIGLVLFALFLLIIVLIPFIGREINGAMRWIPLGFMNLQPSEIAKLFTFIYIASYLQRHKEGLKNQSIKMLVPIFVLGFLALLLLLEPDFGSAAILMAVGLCMIFLANVSLWRFILLILLTVAAMIIVLISAPYRLARLKTYLDPWAYQYGEGYQLINSLMAIGRGDWFGAGIGESIQKLGYLPEAHTDFIFAIYAEETGLIGIIFLVLLLFIVLTRSFAIGQRAEVNQMFFGASLCYGLGIWIVGQSLVNLGVVMGVLPTKGLTLPFISYGGSSIITLLLAVALIFRVDIDSQYADKLRIENALAREQRRKQREIELEKEQKAKNNE